MTAVWLVGGLAAVAVPAVLPLVAVLGRRAIVWLLLLPAGGLLATAAADLAVASGISMSLSLVATDATLNVAAVSAIVIAWRRRPPVRAVGPRGGLAAALAVVGVGLTRLIHPALDWDARSIWLLHARLLRAGGRAYLSAMHNPAYAFAHVDYPPLAPASIAAAWKVTGRPSYRLAQVLIAGDTAALLVVAAVLVVALVSDDRRPWRSAVLAATFTVACLGSAGAYFTNGYTDVLVAAGATAGAVALLALPPSRTNIVLGLISVGVAASTKDEGLVAALLVLGLWVVRSRNVGVARVVRRAAGVAALILVWPAVVAARGGPHGSILTAGTVAAGAHTSRPLRFAHAVGALAGHLPVLPPVAAATFAALVTVRRHRLPRAMDPVGWLWAAAGVDVAVLLVTYTFGRLPIHYWLRTSAERVALFPAMLMYAAAVVVYTRIQDVRFPGGGTTRSGRAGSRGVGRAVVSGGASDAG